MQDAHRLHRLSPPGLPNLSNSNKVKKEWRDIHQQSPAVANLSTPINIGEDKRKCFTEKKNKRHDVLLVCCVLWKKSRRNYGRILEMKEENAALGVRTLLCQGRADAISMRGNENPNYTSIRDTNLWIKRKGSLFRIILHQCSPYRRKHFSPSSLVTYNSVLVKSRNCDSAHHPKPSKCELSSDVQNLDLFTWEITQMTSFTISTKPLHSTEELQLSNVVCTQMPCFMARYLCQLCCTASWI